MAEKLEASKTENGGKDEKRREKEARYVPGENI